MTCKGKLLILFYFICVNPLQGTHLDILRILDGHTGQLEIDDKNYELKREAKLNAPELIKSNGYPVESHFIQTKDQYILQVHRIPNGKNEDKNKIIQQRRPVFLMHGLFALSDAWVDNRQHSLGFILADAGYDVWLGNFRGNPYTRHLNYSKDSKEFWNFSWDEHAQYDLTASIDYILKITNNKTVLYVGYSLGTLTMFALLSSKPEYNAKVAVFVALAPVTSISYITGLLLKSILLHTTIIRTRTTIDNGYFYRVFSPTMTKLIANLCPIQNPTICEMLITSIVGYDTKLRNMTRDRILITHATSGGSVKCLVHFHQVPHVWSKNVNWLWIKLRILKKFSRFDYGPGINLWKYKMNTAPEYDISQITTPIALFYSANDVLADPLDVELTARKLKSVIYKELQPVTMFNHLNFIVTNKTKTTIYQNVISILAIADEMSQK